MINSDLEILKQYIIKHKELHGDNLLAIKISNELYIDIKTKHNLDLRIENELEDVPIKIGDAFDSKMSCEVARH